MSWYDISAQYSGGMQQHGVLKFMYKEGSKSKSPCNKSSNNRWPEIEYCSVYQDPECIKSEQQTKSIYRLYADIHGKDDQHKGKEKADIQFPKQIAGISL